MRPVPPLRYSLVLLCAVLATGCSVTPAYHRPVTPEPAAFKEAHGFVPAAPADLLERGPWWRLFGDPVLDELMASVDISNQNVAQAVAAYDQARAQVTQQRASLFPLLALDASANRSGARGEGDLGDRYRLSLDGSWEPDVWGRLRAGVAGANAIVQSSAADLAGARLSAQGALASSYFSLRSFDAQRALLATTIEGYKRVLQITRNRYEAGIAPQSDVLQAETQLANSQADDLTLANQRAQAEHTIAILIGKAPADFSLPVAPVRITIPEVPAGVPSTLLQRRPDIAAAERRVAAANNQIGVARAAYFPNIGLNASYGSTTSAVPDLLKASNAVWALGMTAAQTLFNAGATSAAVKVAHAQHESAVAQYRQTVLNAFGAVEDQLAATRILAEQNELRRKATEAADKVETQLQNRYKMGQVVYTDVVTAQVTALNARRALVQLEASRQLAAVALIQALGGGWHADLLAEDSPDQMRAR
ncbi:efflux transporter outer membrane subunit [Massilia horti]|uniref:Efflux transporter outer membrane subunit n=1 Tax=Massilia horti TaxID=2562153 RepID=A0A4Y9T3M3_9BURK|nr:efflux transporter outer membrane subunit [Massilia horti]TFW31543.1 efflux transporter outer membrane subunit [Massilia horti]